ncbi:MAG: glycogen debranching enzyme, partial [Candidatus Cellulosilyticum pullistercoris]|nr:glycogen debranching enzyme [Candidatus Cellulosilyticum pullistercoris]
DTIRKFIKGDQGIVPAVSVCMMGKEIPFVDTRKGKNHTIHFITAHDGFTMWDLVSYNHKHNEANGENNRDGHNANYSYNWGFEGETQEENINHRRRQVIKNLMSLLLLSKGTPMLLMGDEFGRTQKGNNNAFCQDNDLVWVDWNKAKENSELLYFTTNLITIRNQLEYFKDKEPYEISWHGVQYQHPDWSYYSRSIACYMKGKESLFLISNNYHEALTFELPPIKGKWCCIMNTAVQNVFEETITKENYYEVKAYSVCLFKVNEEV